MEHDLLPYHDFGKLRLRNFRPGTEIHRLEDWEFQEALWVGEAIGWSEWLCLEASPDTLRSLAVDFDEFPSDAAEVVMQTIGLPFSKGMSLEDVQAVLGQPTEVHRFVPDRASYIFATCGEFPYLISCTLRNDTGLSYVVVMRPLAPNELIE